MGPCDRDVGSLCLRGFSGQCLQPSHGLALGVAALSEAPNKGHEVGQNAAGGTRQRRSKPAAAEGVCRMGSPVTCFYQFCVLCVGVFVIKVLPFGSTRGALIFGNSALLVLSTDNETAFCKDPIPKKVLTPAPMVWG